MKVGIKTSLYDTPQVQLVIYAIPVDSTFMLKAQVSLQWVGLSRTPAPTTFSIHTAAHVMSTHKANGKMFRFNT